ncbi:MAG: carbamoyltransferase [Planctomycetes bacterium]|nr:carbamoyltransferase [Planctomycetota bacterium]
MLIIGISCFYHDAAAAIVKDGVLIAAAEEERFTRKKHTADFPTLAVKYCLEAAGATIEEVDHIAFYEKPFVKFDRILTTVLAEWPLSYNSFIRAMPLWLKSRLWMKKTIRKELGTEKDIIFGDHHLAHAASAFLVSPFDRAVILTLDGVGEWTTTTRGYGEGIDIHLEDEIQFPHSIGLFYSALTAYLGFEVNDAEWKVMGLAPYGKPTMVDKFEKLVQLRDDGSFRLDLQYFAHHHSAKQMINSRYERLMGRPRRVPESELETFHHDVAHSGQKMTEKLILNLARSAYEKYRIPNLCIAGGVGLNSVANWKILKETPFEKLFVQPAAGDDGGALGVAFWVWNCLLHQPRRFTMTNAYFGPAYENGQISGFLKSAGIRARELSREELVAETAKRIRADRVIGWFQGRMEFGPRALGSRSILANPMNPNMKDIINAKVKFRERFRPFAPSVLREEVSHYFDLDDDSPYMLLVPKVKNEKRDLLPAITHEDGTGRVQTVTKADNPLYYDLIREFQKLTGVPVVVNTSFNVRGEPIVCTPEDAYNCFKKSGIDVLVLGNYILDKDANGEVVQ